jgi:hypothetical protein
VRTFCHLKISACGQFITNCRSVGGPTGNLIVLLEMDLLGAVSYTELSHYIGFSKLHKGCTLFLISNSV